MCIKIFILMLVTAYRPSFSQAALHPTQLICSVTLFSSYSRVILNFLNWQSLDRPQIYQANLELINSLKCA